MSWSARSQIACQIIYVVISSVVLAQLAQFPGFDCECETTVHIPGK